MAPLTCSLPVKLSILLIISVYAVVVPFHTQPPRLPTLRRCVVGQLLLRNLRFGAKGLAHLVYYTVLLHCEKITDSKSELVNLVSVYWHIS